MKTILTILIAVMLAAMTASMTDLAWGAPEVVINATVVKKCGPITAGTLTLVVDPSTTGSISSTGTDTTVQCTRNILTKVSANSANASTDSTNGILIGKLTQGADHVPYSLTFTTSFTGAGFGAAAPTVLVPQNGAVLSLSDAQTAAYTAGSYSDSVTLTVTY